MEKIADKFFKHDGVKLNGDFKKTDLCKFLEHQYGEMVYVNSPGFFISVCKVGKDTYLFDKLYSNASEQYSSLFGGSLIEVGCWVPIDMRKYVHRKQPVFPNNGFELSKFGYTIVDVEEKDFEIFKKKKSELDYSRIEKFFHKYTKDNILFDRLDLFDSNYTSSSKKLDLVLKNQLSKKAIVGMVVNNCNPEKAEKFLHVSTHKWIKKFEEDLVSKSFESAIAKHNIPHAKISLKPNSVVLINLYNPKYCFGFTSNGKHSTFELSNSFIRAK